MKTKAKSVAVQERDGLVFVMFDYDRVLDREERFEIVGQLESHLVVFTAENLRSNTTRIYLDITEVMK